MDAVRHVNFGQFFPSHGLPLPNGVMEGADNATRTRLRPSGTSVSGCWQQLIFLSSAEPANQVNYIFDWRVYGLTGL